MVRRLRVFSGNRQGSFTLEYAVLIAVAAAALIGMSIYIKRSLCGKWRESADVFGYGRQYENGVTKCYDGSGIEIDCYTKKAKI